MDQVKFHAWIIPGLIIRPFHTNRSPLEAANDILDLICKRHHVNRNEFKANTNNGRGKAIGSTARVVYVKQMFWYFMKDIYKDEYPLKMLGAVVNVRDHSSVIHGINTYRNMIEANGILPPELDKLHPGVTVRGDYVQFNEQVRPWL